MEVLNLIDIYSNNFGKEVKEQLVILKMSQLELASKVGIKQSYMNDILNNNRIGRKVRKKIVEVIEKRKMEFLNKEMSSI